MSYILDALRRAEAERQRGQVPGLGAATAPLPVSDTLPLARRPAWWLALLLVAVSLASGVVWWLIRDPASQQVPARSAMPAAVPPAPASVAAVAAVAAPQPPLPVVVSAPAAPPVTQGTGGADPRPGAGVSQAATAWPAASAAASDGPTVRLAELSPQQRSEWPPLAWGGSVWSDSAASRFVIIDGQVLHEGQTVRPGMVLERIGPKAAWLRWRGLRVEVPL